MTIDSLLSWGVSYLGQTFQEVRDIYDNGRAVYTHGDLVTGQVKVLPAVDCANELQVHHLTYRSRLFLFRDYSFQIQSHDLNCSVQATAITDHPSSLMQVFIQESLWRLVKAVAVIALTILTFPVWALASMSQRCRDSFCDSLANSWNRGVERAYQASSEIHLDLPLEPADSHVTREDILRIGPAMIGYRHVSTEEHAQENAQKGFTYGCSLNLSFCGAESSMGTAKFQGLHRRITRGENCDDLIKEYESAITAFIRSSIYMDHEGSPVTYGDLFATLDKTRFMIVKTGWFQASDVFGYGQLGRFPAESVGPEKVTLLRRITREELNLDVNWGQRLFSCPQEKDALAEYIASFYRQELLRYIREDFDPQAFEQSLL